MEWEFWVLWMVDGQAWGSDGTVAVICAWLLLEADLGVGGVLRCRGEVFVGGRDEDSDATRDKEKSRMAVCLENAGLGNHQKAQLCV